MSESVRSQGTVKTPETSSIYWFLRRFSLRNQIIKRQERPNRRVEIVFKFIIV